MTEHIDEIGPLVSYAWQLYRPNGWTDIATGESYAELVFCGIEPIKNKVRLIRRTVVEEVVPL